MWSWYPPIRVHIWGGMGSQLFGWAQILSIQKRYPNRATIAVLHNSGITRRDAELSQELLGCYVEYVQDFLQPDKKLIPQIHFRVRYFLTGLIRAGLRKLGFVARANDDREFENIKPWVTSMRGHYSYRSLPFGSIEIMMQKLFSKIEPLDSPKIGKSLSVHYRLGDLETLESKKPIEIEQLTAGIIEAINYHQYKFSQIFVGSDSPHLAVTRLLENLPDFYIYQLDAPIKHTICSLVSSSIFVGSPSKISLWVTIFRINSKIGDATWLPHQMNSDILKNIKDISQIKFY